MAFNFITNSSPNLDILQPLESKHEKGNQEITKNLTVIIIIKQESHRELQNNSPSDILFLSQNMTFFFIY